VELVEGAFGRDHTCAHMLLIDEKALCAEL
jgi:hypothetical protein